MALETISSILEIAKGYYSFLMVCKTSWVFSSISGVNLIIPYLLSTSSTKSSTSKDPVSDQLAPSTICLAAFLRIAYWATTDSNDKMVESRCS